MIETLPSLERKVHSAQGLKQVVRTMKNLAAVNIRPYEQAVAAQCEYYRTVELGLLACFRDLQRQIHDYGNRSDFLRPAGLVIFGSDQGLVGEFNEHLASFFLKSIETVSGETIVIPVGDRIRDRLLDSQLTIEPAYRVPDSVAGIIPLISQILLDLEAHRPNLDEIFIFHNRPRQVSFYEPVRRRLLPLDETWLAEVTAKQWPTRTSPEIFQPEEETRAALIREYLFVSLFQACAESLASENASRLASMQRAEKNINDSLEQLKLQYHQQRQNSIDEELFDVISGFEALQSQCRTR